MKLLGQLEFLHHEGGNQEELSEVQEQARQLGHELYGQPQPEIRDAALNELWNILDSKTYYPIFGKDVVVRDVGFGGDVVHVVGEDAIDEHHVAAVR